MKFIRLGQHYVEKNSEGILAYINNHSFLDNPTFRGMRWQLLQTFDEIYILDLHGNSKKKEAAPDGGKDENVFDIQQGVSINLFIKTSQKKKGALAQLYHCDLYGKRQSKYDWLWQHNLDNIDWKLLNPTSPMYFFIPRDVESEKEYQQGFSVADCFPVNSVGIVTARDELTIRDAPEDVRQVIHDFAALDPEEARVKYRLRKDVQDWKVHLAQQDLRDSGLREENIVSIAYRPFDTRYTYYTGRPKGFLCRPRREVMRHFLAGENLGISTSKGVEIGRQWEHVFITDKPITHHTVSLKEVNYLFPLYLYPDAAVPRIPNLDASIVKELETRTGLSWQPDAEDVEGLTPLAILDYIYAVLHSPNYRQRYAEFLKSDFPRIPWPKGTDNFRQLAALGGRLRQVHLLEAPEVDEFITTYPQLGDNQVTRSAGKNDYEITDAAAQAGRVWINEQQYFDGIPKTVWDFYIGGYQPARKWLKDRKGKPLDFDAIRHYQRIIKALFITGEIMATIDSIEFLP